jgi:hypothetical protein
VVMIIAYRLHYPEAGLACGTVIGGALYIVARRRHWVLPPAGRPRAGTPSKASAASTEPARPTPNPNTPTQPTRRADHRRHRLWPRQPGWPPGDRLGEARGSIRRRPDRLPRPVRGLAMSDTPASGRARCGRFPAARSWHEVSLARGRCLSGWKANLT